MKKITVLLFLFFVFLCSMAHAQDELTFEITRERFDPDQLYCYTARVDKIIDGDTFWAYVKMPQAIGLKGDFRVERIKIRLYRVDTPEMRPKPYKYVNGQKIKKTGKEIRAEKKAAKKAKKFLTDLLPDLPMVLQYKEGYSYRGNPNNRWVCVAWVFSDGEVFKIKDLLKEYGHTTGKYETDSKR